MKRVPSFWYDYSAPATMPIIVESDDPKYPLIAKFYGSPDSAMCEAWNLIQDMKAGRVDYRRRAREEAKEKADV
jgi:hypothetical protein